MEFVKGWFGYFELKVKNDLSVWNGLIVAGYFLVAFEIADN